MPIRDLNDESLARLSLDGQLYLSLAEMQTIRGYFRDLARDPTDAELETIAQTWSEHCSHKTLAGRIAYRDDTRERRFDNMLKETIFAATVAIRQRLGERDWCVSVFSDNAGVVRFDDQFNVVFKVETHNHPSALEPYGGANTGIGGVIRDTLGTGLGAKPICNTDVFCFAPPDTPADQLPPGVLHPLRVMKGVVSGVRDYGNRMGIPTVNGAIYFDRRYLGNPLVYCGSVGLIPRDKTFKQPQPGDYIVALGGRTGRDGIHGATFSSAELTSQSESLSGGAVQIGNAITEKMVLDVMLAARDRGLYHAITDCGAGGFSSAVGEMGEKIGAEVWLDKAPVKYDGLSYTEIWISEAQERMVLSVSPDHWHEFDELCRSEGVEATVIGRFVPTGRLQLKYGEHKVADLDMRFLHDGRPPVLREAVYAPPATQPLAWPTELPGDFTDTLTRILGSLNVASKHWVIRQYDHEVQGGSVIKPLVGVANDGPSDAAVVRPVLASQRGLVVACGMNPYYGDFDTYHMAACAIDEALRNCVAVGRRPGADRHPRQLLLGQHGSARDARFARPGRPGLSRPGRRARHAVHQRQGQLEQRIPLRRQRRPALIDRHSALAVDQCPGASGRRDEVRDDGSEGARQPAVPGRWDEGRVGRIAFWPGARLHGRAGAASRSGTCQTHVRGAASGNRCRPGACLSRSERRRPGRRIGGNGLCRRLWRQGRFGPRAVRSRTGRADAGRRRAAVLRVGHAICLRGTGGCGGRVRAGFGRRAVSGHRCRYD